MANNPGNSDKFRAAGWEKFDLNLRSHLEICHGKQAHADIAEIDTKTVQLGRLGEYLHGGVQQLAFPASPVWFEAPFEDHLSTGKDTVAKRSLRAKITNVQWNVERWLQPFWGNRVFPRPCSLCLTHSHCKPPRLLGARLKSPLAIADCQFCQFSQSTGAFQCTNESRDDFSEAKYSRAKYSRDVPERRAVVDPWIEDTSL